MSKVAAYGAIVVAVLALAISLMSGGTTTIERVVQQVGSPVTQTNFDAISVKEFTQGGGWLSTTTTSVLRETDLESNNGIYITAAGAGQAVVSLTLPATSTMTRIIPDVGDCREWIIDNSDTAAATTTTIVAGTGVELVGMDATGAGTGADVIDGAEYGRLTMCRKVDTNVVAYVEEFLNAD